MYSDLVRRISYQYELLDSKNTHKAWLYNVQSCSISYKWLSQLKVSATFNIEEDSDIDYLNDRIKVYVTLNGVQTSLGVFMLCTPSLSINSRGYKSRIIEAYSLLQILVNDKITTRLQLPIGTNIINEVIRQIGDYSYDIDASSLTLNSSKEYEIGTSKIDIINDLLSVINYTSVNVSTDGKFTTQSYVLPEDRVIELTLKEGNDTIIREMTEDLDLFNAPNVFVRYTNSLDVNPPLSYTYTNDSTSSITSTVNRNGMQIVDCQEVEAANLETLISITKKDAAESSSKYSHLTFSTIYNHLLLGSYMPCVYIDCNGIKSKYLVTSLDYTLKSGEQIKCEARKGVNV